MTMSLPATLPTPATTGKAGSAAPGKGIASAPGQNEGAAADAAGVAGMFAALVATLTAQMQPVANDATVGTGEVVAESAPVTVAAPGLALVLAEAGVDATAVVAADAVAAPVVDAAEGATPQAATPVVDTEVALATAVPTQSDADAGEGGQGDAPKAAMPATPATATNETEGPATPATPAAPAQPSAAPRTEAAAAALLAPQAAAVATDKPEVDRGIATVSATPATPASAAAERAVAAAPARPATPPADPHVQVARVVRPLRLGNDGTYELALDLTPAELGRVRIDVELRGATISMTLRADNPATRDLLQSSLDQLRSELEAAGLHAGNLDVGGRGASRGGTDEQHTPSAAGADAAPEVADTTPAEPTITAEDTTSGVNVLA